MGGRRGAGGGRTDSERNASALVKRHVPCAFSLTSTRHAILRTSAHLGRWRRGAEEVVEEAEEAEHVEEVGDAGFG